MKNRVQIIFVRDFFLRASTENIMVVFLSFNQIQETCVFYD